MTTKKRLRIFAGSNGSGKSTLVSIIQKHDVHFGAFILGIFFFSLAISLRLKQ